MRAWRGSPPAARRLVAAYGSLPRSVIDLACHAAVPVAVDARLLHLIRVNLLLDPPAAVPYEAEADLLLSPLVRELGDGLYDIDPVLRPLLLTGLSRRFGPARPRRVAALLEQYTMRAPAWQDRPELQHAQRLTAVAVIDPPLAADWLARAQTSIADGSALLATEWLVAVRRSVRDHAPADQPPGEDVHEAFEALASGTGDERVAAAHRLGELALVPGADVEAIARMLAGHADDGSPSGQTAREVLDTITGLGPALVDTDDQATTPALTDRQRLLDVWRALAEETYGEGAWIWSPGATKSSISDALQLLCILLPGTESDLALDQPNRTSDEAVDALRNLGNASEIPRLLIKALIFYLQVFQSEDGTPSFTGNLDGTNPQLRSIDLTEAYAISVRLTLSALGFGKVFRRSVTRHEVMDECDELERLASDRLSAAMIGLLRSFTVHTFAANSEPGQNLLRWRRPQLWEELRQVSAGIRDEVTIGSGSYEAESLARPDTLFECGWSWGVVADAPVIDTIGARLLQPQGVASPVPDLWCTMLAVTAIEHLFSERTRLLGLLDDEQQRLSRALQLRHDLTASYWRIVGSTAADGPDRRLAVATIVGDPRSHNGISAAVEILREVAEHTDTVVAYPLEGADSLGPMLAVQPVDVPSALLRQVDRLAAVTRDPDQLARLSELREAGLADLFGRRNESGLWDDWAVTFGAVEVLMRRR